MEQFGGKAVFASDLYALGATLIHLLTRTPPADLPLNNLTIQFKDRISLEPSFTNWLSKMTNPDVEKRFQTAKQALRVLSFFDNKNYLNLVKSNYNSNLLISDRIKVKREEQYLEIKIAKKGVSNLVDFITITTIILVTAVSSLLCFTILSVGIIVLIFCLGCFYPYLKDFVEETNLKFNNEKFSISKKSFLLQIEKGDTHNIQDISVNYSIIKERKKSIFSYGDAITLITKNNYDREYEQCSFGKGITEKEAIYIADLIRNWLRELNDKF